MPELKWNEYDFIECLGVLSKFDEEWVEYSFEYKRDDLILEIFIKTYESLVQIYLSQESNENPFLIFSFVVRGGVRYVNEKNSAFLEFSDCIIANYYDSEFFDKNKFSTYSTFEIHTFPKFQLKFY